MPKLTYMFIAACLLIACGQPSKDRATADPPTPPAVPIPTHVLTEDRAEMLVEVEVGDRIEVHLPEPSAPLKWEQQVDQGLVLAGPPEGQVQDTKKGPVRVFRYLARNVGQTTLRFALTDPESKRPLERAVAFTINTR